MAYDPETEIDKYPWMAIAETELGISEIPGPESEARIQEYIASTTYPDPHPDDSKVPWCSCFVNWVIRQAGLPGTDSAWARSWLQWGKEADWDNLIPGAIVILRRGEKHGHVGFFVDSDPDANIIILLGGNQNDKVCFAEFSQGRILGIRIPA